MFSHIMIGTNDLDKAKRFYDAVLGTLGVPAGAVDRHRVFWRTPTGVFSVTLPIDGKPATVGNGGTIGFACQSAAQGPAACTWPICATRTATRSARCTACPRAELAAGHGPMSLGWKARGW